MSVTAHNSPSPNPVSTEERSSPPRVPAQRIGAVALSTLAAVATWLVAELAPGVAVAKPTFDAINPTAGLGIGAVIVTAVLATTVGWVLLAILERTTNRPKVVWTVAAVGVALVSLVGPITASGLDIGQRIVLVLLHAAVSMPYVLLMIRTISSVPRAEL